MTWALAPVLCFPPGKWSENVLPIPAAPWGIVEDIVKTPVTWLNPNPGIPRKFFPLLEGCFTSRSWLSERLRTPWKTPTSIRPVQEKNMYFSTLMEMKEKDVCAHWETGFAEISHPCGTQPLPLGLWNWQRDTETPGLGSGKSHTILP